MVTLKKPRYLKICDIHNILNYIFKGYKRPHYIQLNPKPTLVVIINLMVDDKNSNDSISKKQNYYKPIPILKDNAVENNKEKKMLNDNKRPEDYIFKHLGLDFKVHLNENMAIKDLFDNFLKSIDISKTTLNLVTPENLELIEKQDINHVFSYSCYIKSQTHFDVSIFNTYLKPDRITPYFLVAIDCEMVMCEDGRQIGRITILDSIGNVIYDKYVKPESAVLDYLEKYSGLNPLNVSNGINRSQLNQDLLEIIGTNTFILGHGLENDLEVLRFYTDKIIDTAYLFLSCEGYKVKLSQLSKKYFGSIIQKEVHSSKEDAYCCLRLLAYKIGQLKNFYDPEGENIDLPVEIAKITNQMELNGAKGIRFFETNEIDINSIVNDNSVFYFVLYSKNDVNLINFRQKNR